MAKAPGVFTIRRTGRNGLVHSGGIGLHLINLLLLANVEFGFVLSTGNTGVLVVININARKGSSRSW